MTHKIKKKSMNFAIKMLQYLKPLRRSKSFFVEFFFALTQLKFKTLHLDEKRILK